MSASFVVLLVYVLACVCLSVNSSGDEVHNTGRETSVNAADETPATNTPTFITKPMNITVNAGQSATLPCEVKDLSPFLVVWRRDKDKFILYAGDFKITRDSRFKISGTALVIESVQDDDASHYTCQVGTVPPIEITHNLIVTGPPHVHTIPVNGLVVVDKGNTINLTCVPSGFPTPSITWTKREGSLPAGVKNTGISLLISNATRRDGGIYECEASNNVGVGQRQTFRVQVFHKPEIEVPTSRMHGNINSNVELICHVFAEPSATVFWSKKRSNSIIVASQKYKIRTNGTIHSVIVEINSVDDFDNYSCLANNSKGEAFASIEVTGIPATVEITSSTTCEEENVYRLTWKTVSYYKIHRYIIQYRNVLEEWTQLEVKPSSREGPIYEEEFIMNDLRPGSYMVSVRAENELGWSPENDVFKFNVGDTTSAAYCSSIHVYLSVTTLLLSIIGRY